MNVKSFLPILLSVSTSAFVLSGCSDFDNGFDAKEVAYKQNFLDMFGNPDPNQTWSTATRAIVEAKVNMPGEDNYTLKVYTANPRIKAADAKLLGEWSVESASNTSHVFDIPASLKNVWVAVVNKNGGRYLKEVSIKNNACKANFELSVLSTRAAAGITVSETGSKEFPLRDYFDKESTGGFLQTYRESKSSGGHINYDEGLCTDFEFVSTGDPIFITAFYGCTSGHDNIKGFYYFPDSGEKIESFYNDANRQFDIMTIKSSSDAFQYRSWGRSDYEGKATAYNDQWNYADITASYNSIEGIYNYWNNDVQFYKWEDGSLVEDDDHTANGNTIVGKGKTYEITGVPNGAHIVFYMQNGTKCSYTRSALNRTVTFKDAGGNAIGTGHGLDAGLIPSQNAGAYVVGFEDALLNDYCPDGDYDINDAVVVFEGGLIPEDHEDEIDQAQSWIIAYEDLGGSFDYDFNDVVLKVTSVAGRSTATISVMAAGGTLPVALTYNGNTLCSNIHEAFGVDSKTIINAASGKHSEYTPKSFTVTGLTDSAPFALSKVGITVNQGDGSISTIYAPQYYLQGKGEEAIWVGTEESKKDKTIPYAILISTGNWDWPDEEVSITTQTGFTDWVQNASKTNWYDSDSSDPSHNNIWNGINVTPIQPDSEDGVQVKSIAASALSAYSSTGAVITFTISDYAAAGTLAFYSAYTDESSNTPLENVTPSSSASVSADGTVTLTLSADCEAFSDGLYYVYDNTKFKVSSYDIEPVAPSKGQEIDITDLTATSYYWTITKKDITDIVGEEAVDVIITCEISGPFSSMIVGNEWTKIEDSTCTINGNIMTFEFNTSKISGDKIAISGTWTTNSSTISKAYIKVK